ncbi:MFS transporter [Sinirhodobacter populi]|uniref:MFS transporter n=1 Tax=Paenirhodobacter populi TaxID=2306993 RepID=A0A443K0W2_9RHOB|nr:MFS transporter [Sinirhodobacter populi]RWR26355.1 MFS transporter [Sinirhodobacter populi]
MPAPLPTTDTEVQKAAITPLQIGLCAVACGVTVANIYYAQPLIEPISAEFGLSANLAGLIVTITQLGYGAGLFFLVCLGDLLENRRLILSMTALTILGLIGIVLSPDGGVFLLFSFLLGVASVGTQMLVPFVSFLAPPETRGRVIGNIMGGLLTGIMLSRPAASFLGAHFGWRAIFVVSILVMAATFAVLWRILPERRPEARMGYPALLGSTLDWLRTARPLQRRAVYQGVMFAVFNLFWTAGPLMLHARFGLGQDGIALFALAGAGGAIAAPIAGRIADRGAGAMATGIAMLGAAAAFVLSGFGTVWGSLAVLVLAVVVIDAMVQTNQIVSQRIIYALDDAARGRINSAFMTVVFLSGAIGSILGSLSYVDGGWWMTAGLGAVLCVAVWLFFRTE